MPTKRICPDVWSSEEVQCSAKPAHLRAAGDTIRRWRRAARAVRRESDRPCSSLRGGIHAASGHAFNRDNVHALVEEVMRSPRLLLSVDIPEEGGDEDAPVRALLGGHNP